MIDSENPRVCMLNLLSDPVLRPLISMIRSADSSIKFVAIGDWVLGKRSDLPLDFEIERFPWRPLDAIKSIRKPVSGGSQLRVTNSSNNNLLPNNLLRESVKDIGDWLERGLNGNRIQSQLQQYDLLHVQSIFSSRLLKLLMKLKNLPPIVVSLWGSDVMRSSDMKLLTVQQKFLRRVDLITATGIEFKQIVLAKYGHDLAPKIRETYFSANFDLLSATVNLEKSKAKVWMAKKLGLAPNKHIVAVGHNGSPQNQHLEVIQQFASLSDGLKSQLQILVQMSYGGSSAYKMQVEQALASVGLSGVVSDEFFSNTEMPYLRKCVDVFIYTPISDAFSATVTQALTAGCIVVTGSWLPYSRRRRSGFRYWEVDEFAELPLMLEDLVTNLPRHQEHVAPNANLGLEFFDEQRLGRQWADVYREAIQNHIARQK